MIKRFTILALCFLFAFYYLPIFLEERTTQSPTQTTEVSETMIAMQDQIYPLPANGFEHYIGEEIGRFVKRYGEPLRTGPSSQSTEWWVYGTDSDTYLQVEVKDDIIQSIFVLGDQLNTGAFRIGMNRDNVLDETELAQSFSFSEENQPYQLQLSNLEFRLFPLIQFENQSFLMLYFHPDTNEVYAMRYLSNQSLLKLNFYAIMAEREEKFVAVAPADRSPAVTAEKELQLQTFLNVVRAKNGLPTLKHIPELTALAEGIIQRVGKNRLIFAEEEDWVEAYAIEKMIYITGQRVYDTPSQFGLLFMYPSNRQVLYNESYQSMGIKSLDDDLLLLLEP